MNIVELSNVWILSFLTQFFIEHFYCIVILTIPVESLLDPILKSRAKFSYVETTSHTILYDRHLNTFYLRVTV